MTWMVDVCYLDTSLPLSVLDSTGSFTLKKKYTANLKNTSCEQVTKNISEVIV
jgi:hypothetical protein